MQHVRDGLKEATRKKVTLSVHCHNDFGLATANTLAAVEEGATYLHTCIVGFGERAGIAPFEEVVAALELLYNIDTGIDLGKIYRLAQSQKKPSHCQSNSTNPSSAKTSSPTKSTKKKKKS